MVPINFWQNSDQFEKKRIFFSSKFDKLRGFQRKSLKFSKENLSNPKHESLKCFWCNYEDFEYQIIKDLDPFHSEMTFLNQSATYLSSRAQGPPPPPPPPAPLVPSPPPHPLTTLHPLDKEIFCSFYEGKAISSPYISHLCVYVCKYTIIRDQPYHYQRSAPTIRIQPQEAKMFLTKKQQKNTAKCSKQV